MNQAIRENPGVSVADSRPSRVRSFLNKQSARMVGDLPVAADKVEKLSLAQIFIRLLKSIHFEQEEIDCLLTYRRRHNVTSCLHNKPVSVTMYNINCEEDQIGERSSPEIE